MDKNYIIMTKKGITLIVLIIGMFFGSDLFSQVVVVKKPARPKVVVVKPASPGRNHVWIDGHWKYSKNQRKYVWVKGHYTRVKRGHTWVPGHWAKAPGGWKWVPGHWKRAVKVRRVR